ncbi:hypothetical protein RvY_09382 [Ramazzottius varieornatus]|uniref:Uncharacterized protein n=1 Tax=Ramazzottius varieornatus TaxID=947166 RepID=A0A1D1V989_RAMVA|nr:hypothetical protein RvY_09382 [Ramazzottius varieornatus]
MESVNPFNILNLLLSDYEQHFQLSDSPSESDTMLKTLIKDFLDVQIDQDGSSISATEENLQYELLIGVSTSDQLGKSIAKTTCSVDIAKQTSNPLRRIALSNLLQVEQNVFPMRFFDVCGYYNICARKVTRFVTEKYLKQVPDRKKSAEECVAVIRERVQAYGKDCLWNANHSGFEYGMRPGRTLDFVGAKHVSALTRSQNSMTHGYTVFPLKFLQVHFITLQEPKEIFRPLVEKSMFRASNLYATAFTSGKMTKELHIEWCEKVFFSHMSQYCIFLADSWSSFSD